MPTVEIGSYYYKADKTGLGDATNTFEKALTTLKGKSGKLILPIDSRYKITRPLTYLGDFSKTITFEGGGCGSKPEGSVLYWDGPVGGTLFTIRGGKPDVIGMGFDANYKGKIALVMDNPLSQTIVQFGTIERCFFANVVGEESSPLVLGGKGSEANQVSEISVRHSKFYGDSRSKYGVWLGSANTKNFDFYHCDFNGFDLGVCQEASGNLALYSCTWANNRHADIWFGAGYLTIRDFRSECSRMFIDNTYGLFISTVNIAGGSWIGTAGEDDVVFNCGLNTIMSSMHFRNERVPGAIPKFKIGQVHEPNFPSSFKSEGNFYENCTRENTPWFDGNMNQLWGNPAFPNMRLKSTHDFGGTNGNLIPLEEGL